MLYIQGFCTHIFAECILPGWWPLGSWPCHLGGCMPPTMQLISSMANVLLICYILWLNSIMMPFFMLKIVYIIIDRHPYRDVRALQGQLVMYVLKHFICQSLLYVRVT